MGDELKMNRFSVILLFLFGLFMAPATTYACGKGASHACEKERKVDNDSCCGKKAPDGQPCKGKCGNKSCGCPTAAGAAASLVTDTDFEIPFKKIFLQENGFSYAAPSVSGGFFTIWLIPKIS